MFNTKSTPKMASPRGTDTPHIVILGAGFAGLHAARGLRNEPVRVTIVDQHNYHKFQPLLYQVATAGLNPDDIARNIRENFWRDKNISFHLGKVKSIDTSNNRVQTEHGSTLSFDYLIVGAGTVSHYFGIDGAEEHSHPLKELPQATALRDHILQQFEKVSQDPSLVDEGVLRFVVTGAGPTGVEMAGALAELFDVMQNDYPEIDTELAEVVLVEMVDQVLPTYKQEIGEYAQRELERRGVRVLTGKTVEKVTDRSVTFADGESLQTHSLIWTAGVQSNPLARDLSSNERDDGRVPVYNDLSLSEHSHIFIAGDMAAIPEPDGPHPQLAPVAVQQGKHAAAQILRIIEGKETQPFSYRDQGKMATIGRNAAVAEFPNGASLTGFVAWAAWVLIHIAKLVGFRNRLTVFVNWAFNYFTFNRSSRIILDMMPADHKQVLAPDEPSSRTS